MRQRGIDFEQEMTSQQLIRDTRSLGQRIAAILKDPDNTSVALIVCAAICWFFPIVIELTMISGLFFFFFCIFSKAALPFRLPQYCGLNDYNDPQIGNNKPRKARGISFVGNEIKTGQELWFNNDDMRTHVLIFGSTGSGKTVTLISFVFNALMQSSGFIYVDGKGDNTLFASIFSMTRRMGREDDLLLVNFMTGARDIIGPQKTRLSNTLNPFATGSSSMLSQLVVSLMESGGQQAGGDGDMWKNRAISFVEALMRILVYMRDQGHLLLDPNTIRNYFVLPRIESIVLDKKFPLDSGQIIPLDDIPPQLLDALRTYLDNLPGFDRNKKGKQSGETLEQHGFITMQLTRTFTSLADTYAHILRTNLAEVDFKDVILNRRILVVLLPALEKSPAELANLGKLIVASLKAMMAAGLGDEVEGSYRDVIERKPTNAPTPFMCVLDEYGYYAVQGFAVVPAQARSLGFSAIFAGQDLPAFQKSSKEEAASIGANTNIKICMKLEDPTETWEFFSKLSGEAYVTSTSGFQTQAGSFTQSYLDTRSAQVEKRARVDLQDLRDQREGEAHVFFKSKIIRARMFFANPRPVKELRVNQFLRVDKPLDLELAGLNNRLMGFQRIFERPTEIKAIQTEVDPDLSEAFANFHSGKWNDPINASIGGLLAVYARNEKVEEQQAALEAEEVEDESVVSIFIKRLPASLENDPFAVLTYNLHQAILLHKTETRRRIDTLEQISGRTKAEAESISKKLVSDISAATQFPPSDVTPIEKEDLISSIRTLIDLVKGQKTDAAT